MRVVFLVTASIAIRVGPDYRWKHLVAPSVTKNAWAASVSHGWSTTIHDMSYGKNDLLRLPLLSSRHVSRLRKCANRCNRCDGNFTPRRNRAYGAWGRVKKKRQKSASGEPSCSPDALRQNERSYRAARLRAKPASPTNPLPNSHTAAGTGTVVSVA